MLSPTIKSKVNELWDKFWSGGISNPLNAIEQITYLLFIKQLDENYLKGDKDAKLLKTKFNSLFSGYYQPPGYKSRHKDDIGVDKATLRWSHFTKLPSDEMYSLVQTQVFPFIKQIGGENSYFTKHMQNAALLIPSPRLLTEAVKKIDEIFAELRKEERFVDALGDFYEYLLSEFNSAGKNGQFRTPPHIIEMMVEIVQPELGNKIADPACGTAGFLLAAYKYILTEYTNATHQVKDENGFVRGSLADNLEENKYKDLINSETFFGFDIDPTMIRIGLMNLMMHGITQPQIDYKDTLSKNYNQDSEYHIVLANPPFTGNIDKGDLNPSFTISTTKIELLFVERIYKMLRMGGIAAVVVPQGVLFGSGKAFVETRKILIEKCELKAVISMPSGVFKPYAGVATAILVFVKGGYTQDVWFYEMLSDGKSLDDKRNELTTSDGKRDYGDLHKVIAAYHDKKKSKDRTKQHFLVPRKEIEENNYDLSISKYKEEVYEEVKYEKPEVILAQLKELETEIMKGIDELMEMEL